jgi:hypothetical protein
MKKNDKERDEHQFGNDYYREYSPYESAPAFLGRRLDNSDKVQLSFVVKGTSDFRAAQAFEQELLSWKKDDFQFTLIQTQSITSDKTQVQSNEPEEVHWRLSGVSKPIKLPSEEDFYLFTGCLWDMASHYGGRLDSCSFRIAT